MALTLDDLPLSPFDRCNCCSWEILTNDGADTSKFGPEAVHEVLYVGGDEVSTVAALFTLKDGRYIVYETFYDMTGDGFRCDAYGGGAEFSASKTFDGALTMLTRNGREMLGLRQMYDDPPKGWS